MKALTVKELYNLGYPENVQLELKEVGGKYEDAVLQGEVGTSDILATAEYLRDLFCHYEEFMQISPIYFTPTDFRLYLNRYVYPKSYQELHDLFGLSMANIRESIQKVRYAILATYNNILVPFPEYEVAASSVGKYVKGDISTYTFIRNPNVPPLVKRAVITLLKSGILGEVNNLTHPQAIRRITAKTLCRVDLIRWTDLAMLEWVFRGELNKSWISQGEDITPLSLKIQTKIWKSSEQTIIST